MVTSARPIIAASKPGIAPHPEAPSAARPHADKDPRGRRLAILTLTALGIVYGDIGTSPLYTLREVFKPDHGLVADKATVYGILSLVFWSLILVVGVKYLLFILRADNRGEGGVLAMLALIQQRRHRRGEQRGRPLLIMLAIFGTALLYGDGVITPAISVLGAVEGLTIVAPSFAPYVVWITVAILLALFGVQRFGTARVGRTFGPITLVWFIVIGMLGMREITRTPQILAAVSPWYGFHFFADHGFIGFAALGAVFLAITGAEALFADLGHFGPRPIRLAFVGIALPALLANYFGQGALLLRDPTAIANPFYLLAPQWFLYPLLMIATMAAIVASQALISGAFSLAHQSVQLGYTPRLTIVHTSDVEHGQIYIPEINRALMIGTLLIVVGFQSSEALGAAYGIAVTGTMAITTILFAAIARARWKWPVGWVIALTCLFMLFDLSFLGSNLLKIFDGGWVPLAIGATVYTFMTTWKHGRDLLTRLMRESSLPMKIFLQDMERRTLPRVPGTAVFLTSDTRGAPVVMLHHLKHNKSLHEQVVLLSVLPAEVPDVPDSERVHVTALGHGFYRVTARFGFMETPNVPHVLELCSAAGLHTHAGDTSYYLGHERLIATGRTKMGYWRKQLFVLLARNARSATEFFGLPSNRVVELGARIEY